MTNVFNHSTEKPKRQLLRNNPPKAEQRLWLRLRNRQLLGYRFRRQETETCQALIATQSGAQGAPYLRTVISEIWYKLKSSILQKDLQWRTL